MLDKKVLTSATFAMLLRVRGESCACQNQRIAKAVVRKLMPVMCWPKKQSSQERGEDTAANEFDGLGSSLV